MENGMLCESHAPAVPVLHLSGELEPIFLEQAAGAMEVVANKEILGRVAACREFVLDSLAAGQSVYGATTGFGPLVSFSGRAELTDQAENTLNHLTTGHGVELEPAVVRAALLARLWSLARGRSGVSVSVVR